MTQDMKSRKTVKTAGFARHVPNVLLGVLVAFLLASLVAGEVFHAYERFWWWDDMLHTSSGVIVGFIGFLMVYFLNARYRMTISPVFVAVFAFTFALSIGALWEIVEFTIDALFHADMQRWNLPPNAVLIGKAYQGSGLRDSMSDLIEGGLGSLFAATCSYYAFKHRKRATLRVMRHTAKRFGRSADH